MAFIRFDGLIVGFDIDGTITDDGGPRNIWDDEVRLYFGVERISNSYDFCQAYDLTSDQVAAFCAERLRAIFAEVPVKPDCAQAIRELRSLGVAVHLITARHPEYATVTEDYLAAHGIAYDGIWFGEDKVEISLELGVSFFADDRAENCLSLQEAGIDCAMVDAFHNTHVDYWPRATSWSEIGELALASLQRRATSASAEEPA